MRFVMWSISLLVLLGGCVEAVEVRMPGDQTSNQPPAADPPAIDEHDKPATLPPPPPVEEPGDEPIVEETPPVAHPCVFLTSDEALALKERAVSQPWAKAYAKELTERADWYLSNPMVIPRMGGQWPHWYNCPDHGTTLQALSPTQHKCPTCGTVYSGWPYDQAYVSQRHTHYFIQVENLGAAYTVTGNIAYANRVRDILLEYASFYRNLDLHDINGEQVLPSQARLFAQTLDEAVELCRIAFGYDLVHDAPCFTEADHRAIEEGLIRPMVETIQANNMALSNIQTWHNAAVACAGWVIGDRAYVEWAFNGPSGITTQLEFSVTSSGMWYEESTNYHWYALTALVYAFEGAQRVGMDLYSRPKVRALFDAPMRQLFPDGTFPALNDSGRTSIQNQRALYEVAYKRYTDSHYAALLDKRNSLWAFLWGADDVPENAIGDFQLTESTNDESEGLAILRSADGASSLMFDYGSGESVHVHPAKLNLIWYTHGEERFVDPGMMPYGNPIHAEWYKTTLAHNTVVVNGQNQKRTNGNLIAFANHDRFAIARATCNTAYDGVTLDRTVVQAGNTILDIFACSSDVEATFDLPLHIRGDLEDLPPSMKYADLGGGDGYAHLQNVRRAENSLTDLSVAVEGGRLAVRFFDDSDCYLADALGYEAQERLPMIVRRKTGTTAVFVAAYQRLGIGEAPHAVAYEMVNGEVVMSVDGVTVTVGAGTSVELDSGLAFVVTKDGLTPR